MDPSKQTNPYLSSVHAMCFSKAIGAASSAKELEAAADRHGGWLLGADRTRLRAEYRARLERFAPRS